MRSEDLFVVPPPTDVPLPTDGAARRRVIEEALRRAGSLRAAAHQLGMPHTTLHRLVRRWHLSQPVRRVTARHPLFQPGRPRRGDVQQKEARRQVIAEAFAVAGSIAAAARRLGISEMTVRRYVPGVGPLQAAPTQERRRRRPWSR